ncbi:chitin deacetylase, partial [Quaeritorhiza haematococci]
VPAIPVNALNTTISFPVCPPPTQREQTCHWSCFQCLRPTDITNCPKSSNGWAITYDDGPAPYTPAILDYLDQKNLKATFFVVGSRVVQSPDILLRAFRAGHQIGVHTWSHRYLTTQPNDVVVAELEYTARAIEEVIGTRPKYFRPPFGDIDDRVRAIAAAMGLTPVMWDRDTFDWQLNNPASGMRPEYITGNFTAWATNATRVTGHTSLQHDLYQASAALAPPTIDLLLKNNWVPMSSAECVNDLAAYKDPNVKVALSAQSPSSSSGGNAGNGGSSGGNGGGVNTNDNKGSAQTGSSAAASLHAASFCVSALLALVVSSLIF